MVGDVSAVWGLFGGFAVEGLELYAAVRHAGRWPWKRPIQARAGEVPEAGAKGYAIAEAIRLIIGAGLAWAAASAGQISGPIGALGVGVAAMTIIGQLAKVVPLTVSPELTETPDSRVAVPADSRRAAAVFTPSRHGRPSHTVLDADDAAEAMD